MSKDWQGIYGDAIRRLPARAAEARLIFCGSGACVDARVSLHDLLSKIASAPPDAVKFSALLQERAGRGQGGEITYDWPEGPTWITSHAPVTYAMGGTGPHAAWTLSAVGAQALLALQDRSKLMLDVTPPGILLAEEGGLVPAASARRSGTSRAPVFIFEYTAGRPVGDVMPRRSSRIIVKFSHFRLEEDTGFERYTAAHAHLAGAGLVSGFSSVAAKDVPGETARVGALVRAWRDRGLGIVHFELGGYDDPRSVRLVLDGLRGAVTSLGMSLSELEALAGGGDVPAAMRAIADEVGVDRMCVHADHWAASLTRWDLDVEREALLAGCLLAASRAAAGRPVLPDGIDPDAVFEPLPFDDGGQFGSWRFVACAAPYLRAPRTTLGLGDTFTGGCLLLLAGGAAGGGRRGPS